nr:uncharacterized protein LOC110587936 [Neomonachus schauinslandi]
MSPSSALFLCSLGLSLRALTPNWGLKAWVLGGARRKETSSLLLCSQPLQGAEPAPPGSVGAGPGRVTPLGERGSPGNGEGRRAADDPTAGLQLPVLQQGKWSAWSCGQGARSPDCGGQRLPDGTRPPPGREQRGLRVRGSIMLRPQSLVELGSGWWGTWTLASLAYSGPCHGAGGGQGLGTPLGQADQGNAKANSHVVNPGSFLQLPLPRQRAWALPRPSLFASPPKPRAFSPWPLESSHAQPWPGALPPLCAGCDLAPPEWELCPSLGLSPASLPPPDTLQATVVPCAEWHRPRPGPAPPVP